MTTALCPCCSFKNPVPEGSDGRRVMCPNCGTPFVVGVAPPPPPPEPEPEAVVPADDVIPMVPLEEPAEPVVVKPAPRRKSAVRPRPPEPEPVLVEVPEDEPEAAPKSRSGCLFALLGCFSFVFVFAVGGTLLISLSVPDFLERLRGEVAQAEVTGLPATGRPNPIIPAREPEFPDASRSSVRLGDVRLTVSNVALEAVKSIDRGAEFISDDKHLVIRLRLENKGAQGITFDGWGSPDSVVRDEVPRLSDDRGASYKRISFAPKRVPGQPVRETIAPDQSVEDLLIFEAKAAEAASLRLELPARNFGGVGQVGFTIPRAMLGAGPAGVAGAGTPPPPPPSPLKAKSAVEVARLLDEADRQVRLDAVNELGSRGPAAALAVKPLARALTSDTDRDVRVAAASALGKIGLLAHEAFGALVKAGGDSDEAVRRAAAAALPLVGPPTRDDAPALAEALGHPQVSARRFAAQTLTAVKLEPRDAAPVYAIALKDTDREVRLAAAQGLGRLDPLGRAHLLPLLFTALRDADGEVRTAASRSLTALGKPQASELAALRPALKDTSPEVRRYAVRALADLGPAARDAVPDLAEAARHPDVEVRRGAVAALGRMGPAAREAVRALSTAASDPDREVRQSAVTALAGLGRDAQLAASDLALAMRDPDPAVRKAAASALKEVDPPAVLRAYARNLDDPSDAVRQEAAEYIASLGAEAREVEPELIRSVRQDTHPVVRAKAARALLRINPQSTAPLGALRDLLKNGDDVTRRHAAETFTLLPPSIAADAVLVLGPATRDADPAVRKSAVAALARLGADARKAAPDLVEALADKKLHEPIHGVLLKIGPACLPDVATGLQHRDPAVRQGAAAALGKFGSAARDHQKALNTAYFAEKDAETKAAISDAMTAVRRK